MAIVVPVAVGFIGGAEMLGGLLAGVTTCGVLMAIFQSNAGGAWDNAKKMIESDGRKGSDAHKAAVVGDTVGDPFKDTSGPSLNILLKLMSVVALVIAPSIAMSSEKIAAYVNDQSDEAIELVVPVTNTEELITINIDAEREQKDLAVQISLIGKKKEVFKNIDKITSTLDDVIGN